MAKPTMISGKRRQYAGTSRPGAGKPYIDTSGMGPKTGASVQAGLQLGQGLFGSEALGRIQEERSPEQEALLKQRAAMMDTAGQRSADIEAVLAARRVQAQQGFSPEELQAMREQQSMAERQAQQGALRSLRGMQAASGVRGGLAAAQASQLAAQAMKTRAQQERDLFLQNIAQKQAGVSGLEQSARAAEAEEIARRIQAMGGYESTLGGIESDELKRRVFNLGQLGQEKFGIVSSGLGMGQMGAAQDAATIQNQLAIDAINPPMDMKKKEATNKQVSQTRGIKIPKGYRF